MQLSGIEYEGCFFITFKMSGGNDYKLINALANAVRNRAHFAEDLIGESELPIVEKYDGYIPAELLRRAYATDALNLEEAEARILEIEAEY
jgi:ATP-dependent Lhr-like helicase